MFDSSCCKRFLISFGTCYILLSSCPILHSYTASVQDIRDGIVRMNRKVTSKDVKDYASHLPGEEVDMESEENIVYRRGILTHSDGTMKAKLMGKVYMNFF